MTRRTGDPATAEEDAVMSWLQDREMKDHKLADARSGIGASVTISSVIERMQEKAYAVFPHMDRNMLDTYVRLYVDPTGRAQGRESV